LCGSECPLQRFNRPKQTVSFRPTQVTAAWRPCRTPEIATHLPESGHYVVRLCRPIWGVETVIRMRSVSAPHRWQDLLDVTTAWCVGKAPTISVNRTVPRTRSASTLWGTPVRNSSISPVIVSASLSHKVRHARLAKARGDDLCREAASARRNPERAGLVTPPQRMAAERAQRSFFRPDCLLEGSGWCHVLASDVILRGRVRIGCCLRASTVKRVCVNCTRCSPDEGRSLRPSCTPIRRC
jgi:hypothetical protein